MLYHVKHTSEFPKRKYAPEGGSVTVHNKTEETALGLGWGDTDPAAEPDVDASAEPPAAEVDKKKKRGGKQ
jgi:hypothetical protein